MLCITYQMENSEQNYSLEVCFASNGDTTSKIGDDLNHKLEDDRVPNFTCAF